MKSRIGHFQTTGIAIPFDYWHDASANSRCYI
jgi:hypothetical protein